MRYTRCLLAHSLASALALAARASSAATLPVTSCADDGSAGTLRSVVLEARDGDVVALGALACNTISLTLGAIDISDNGPHPVSYLTLQGPGMDALTIDAAGTSQVFVHGGQPDALGTLKLADLTLAHGFSSEPVAACIASSGNVTLDHVRVDDCHTVVSSGYVAFGGAVGVSGSLTMESSTISGSSVSNDFAEAVGGGAFVKGNAFLRGSTISGNSLTTGTQALSNQYFPGGGGLFVCGDAHLVESTVSGNFVNATAAGGTVSGGGLVGLRDILVERSTISGNTSSLVGGGIVKSGSPTDVDPTARGMTLIDSTVSGNTAGLTGGVSGSYNLSIENSTITDNHSTYSSGGVYFLGDGRSLLIQSSIISGNTVAAGSPHAPDLSARAAGTYMGLVYVSGDHDLISSADSNVVLPPGTLAGNPLLAPLAANGGPTMTHALLAGSPAIDTGNNFFGFATDQRGFARVAGPAPDIGAFELEQPQFDSIFADGFDPTGARAVERVDIRTRLAGSDPARSG